MGLLVAPRGPRGVGVGIREARAVRIRVLVGAVQEAGRCRHRVRGGVRRHLLTVVLVVVVARRVELDPGLVGDRLAGGHVVVHHNGEAHLHLGPLREEGVGVIVVFLDEHADRLDSGGIVGLGCGPAACGLVVELDGARAGGRGEAPLLIGGVVRDRVADEDAVLPGHDIIHPAGGAPAGVLPHDRVGDLAAGAHLAARRSTLGHAHHGLGGDHGFSPVVLVLLVGIALARTLQVEVGLVAVVLPRGDPGLDDQAGRGVGRKRHARDLGLARIHLAVAVRVEVGLRGREVEIVVGAFLIGRKGDRILRVTGVGHGVVEVDRRARKGSLGLPGGKPAVARRVRAVRLDLEVIDRLHNGDHLVGGGGLGTACRIHVACRCLVANLRAGGGPYPKRQREQNEKYRKKPPLHSQNLPPFNAPASSDAPPPSREGRVPEPTNERGCTRWAEPPRPFPPPSRLPARAPSW